MRINVYVDDLGVIYHTVDGSFSDKDLEYRYEFIKTYEIEKLKPIINPHMQPKKPSYRDAISIISRFFNDCDYTHEECLRDLGFQEGDE